MAEATANHAELTPKQVASLLKVTPSTVRRWITSGVLPATQQPGLRTKYQVKRADAVKLGARPVRPA